jgi:excisionase family DNA binding protein
MNDLYTTRQVQEILKVDRITIYRMLKDGRLKGVKVGRQWRFTRQEVERVVSGESQADETVRLAADKGFPTHCIQTIQDLFSSVSQVSSLMVDMQGNPLTQVSNPCGFCQLMLSSPAGFSACQASWQLFAQQSLDGSRYFTCHAGLQYVTAPVFDLDNQAGLFLAGEFYWQAPEPREATERLRRLAAINNVPLEELEQSAKSVPVIAPERHAQVENWPSAAAQAVQSILQERAGFIQRLQKIADLTQVS